MRLGRRLTWAGNSKSLVSWFRESNRFAENGGWLKVGSRVIWDLGPTALRRSRGGSSPLFCLIRCMSGRPPRDGQFPNRFFQPVCNYLSLKSNFPCTLPPTLYTHLHPHTVPPNDLPAFQSRADRPSRLSLSPISKTNQFRRDVKK